MGEKIFIPGLSETIGEIDKEDWSPLLFEEETVLLINNTDKNKKIWVMNDEWSQKKKETKKTVSSSLTLQQVESEEEVIGGTSESSAEVEWVGEKITLESLESMRLDELLFYAMLQYKEEAIREKIYCMFGYCKNKCGGCDGSSTRDSE